MVLRFDNHDTAEKKCDKINYRHLWALCLFISTSQLLDVQKPSDYHFSYELIRLTSYLWRIRFSAFSIN